MNTIGIVALAGASLWAVAWVWRRFMRFLDRQQGADWGRPWLNRLDGLNRWLCRRFHRLESEPLKLPARGGVIVVANHISGLDPLLMIAASPRPLRFIIAREQYERWYLRWLFRAVGCIPIGRRGGHRRALDAAIEALRRGEAVALFPEGGIRLGRGTPQLKPGVALLAQETGAPICVLRLDGISARGKTLAAVFWRSRARISQRGLIRRRHYESIEQLLTELGQRFAEP